MRTAKSGPRGMQRGGFHVCEDGFDTAESVALSNVFQCLSRGGVADRSRNAKSCAESRGEEQTGNCGFEDEERQQAEVHWTTKQYFGARFDLNRYKFRPAEPVRFRRCSGSANEAFARGTIRGHRRRGRSRYRGASGCFLKTQQRLTNS